MVFRGTPTQNFEVNMCRLWQHSLAWVRQWTTHLTDLNGLFEPSFASKTRFRRRWAERHLPPPPLRHHEIQILGHQFPHPHQTQTHELIYTRSNPNFTRRRIHRRNWIRRPPLLRFNRILSSATGGELRIFIFRCSGRILEPRGSDRKSFDILEESRWTEADCRSDGG